jgi:hypothetical protein
VSYVHATLALRTESAAAQRGANHPAGREHPLADRGLPVGALERRVDLADDEVDHPVEQLFLERPAQVL